MKASRIALLTYDFYEAKINENQTYPPSGIIPGRRGSTTCCPRGWTSGHRGARKLNLCRNSPRLPVAAQPLDTGVTGPDFGVIKVGLRMVLRPIIPIITPLFSAFCMPSLMPRSTLRSDVFGELQPSVIDSSASAGQFINRPDNR